MNSRKNERINQEKHVIWETGVKTEKDKENHQLGSKGKTQDSSLAVDVENLWWRKEARELGGEKGWILKK